MASAAVRPAVRQPWPSPLSRVKQVQPEIRLETLGAGGVFCAAVCLCCVLCAGGAVTRR